jgi:hypothetical protein
VPGDGVKPRQRRLTRTIGVAHFVNAKPGFLQQVVRIGAAPGLHHKESVQLRADALNDNRGRAKIALLIASHQHLEIAFRGHELECLLAIFISTGVFAQIAPAVKRILRPI